MLKVKQLTIFQVYINFKQKNRNIDNIY